MRRIRDLLLTAVLSLSAMADVRFADTWIYTPDYRDAWTSNRLRWQFWTFRYE